MAEYRLLAAEVWAKGAAAEGEIRGYALDEEIDRNLMDVRRAFERIGGGRKVPQSEEQVLEDLLRSIGAADEAEGI